MGMRILAAVAVLVSASVHFDLWFDVRDNQRGRPRLPAERRRWRGDRPPAAVLEALGFRRCWRSVSGSPRSVPSPSRRRWECNGVNATWTGFWVWAALISEVVAIVAGSIAFASGACCPLSSSVADSVVPLVGCDTFASDVLR